MKLDKIYMAGIVAFTAGVIVLTFAFPFRSLRQEALDSTMSSALREVADEVKDYTQENDKLPADLTVLEFDESYSVVNNNTGILKKITYNVADDKNFTKKFNLCADFKTEKESPYKSDSLSGSLFSDSEDFSYSSYSSVDYKTHPKGYHCFDDESVYSSSNYMEEYYKSLYDSESESSDSDTLNFN